MQKEVDIKAVIGFSGISHFIQALFLTGSSYILITSISYIPWDPLLLSDIYFQEPKHS